MAKIRSPRARKGASSTPAQTSAPTPGGKATSSDLVIWYHGNKQWLPLVGTVFGGVAVYLLGQVEVLRPTMGFVAGLAVIVGAAIFGLMRPEDAPVRVGKNRFLPLALLVSAVVVAVALVPYLHVTFPGTPLLHATVSPAHPTGTFEIGSDTGLVEVVVHGALRRGGQSAEGGYEMVLERGGKKRRVEGAFKRTYSTRKIRRGRVRVGTSTEFAYHVNRVPSLGKGRYTLTLRTVDTGLENYLRVKVFAARYDDKMLIYAIVLLTVLGLVVDVLSTKQRHRTRVATAALVATGFAYYFNRQFAPDSVMSTVLGGALVTILAGWIGGGVLAFVAKRVGGEPRAAKASAKDDDEE
ncbi:MAG: hypothetical protein HY996_05160 [Micrococcales bacterium]|nr:hypothetical protein [Micrococcales bacterium]